jgi:hypothetical protein
MSRRPWFAEELTEPLESPAPDELAPDPPPAWPDGDNRLVGEQTDDAEDE